MLNFIHNINVKLRLISFISLLLLLLFFAGAAGLKGMLTSNNTISTVVEHHVVEIEETQCAFPRIVVINQSVDFGLQIREKNLRKKTVILIVLCIRKVRPTGLG